MLEANFKSGKEDFKIFNFEDEEIQYENIASKTIKFLDEKLSVGILTRTKIEAEEIQNYFNRFSISQKINDGEFLEDPLIREIISVLKISKNEKESFDYFFDFLENNFFSSKAIVQIIKISKEYENNYIEKLTQSDILENMEIEDEDKILIKEFCLNILEIKNLLKLKPKISFLVREIIRQFSYYENFISKENLEKINCLNNFLNFCERFYVLYKDNTLKDFFNFLENCKKIRIEDSKTSGPNLEITTIHNSKGKEYDVVFIPSLNEENFRIKKKENHFNFKIEEDNEDLYEEFRIFFVAISRAKQKLYLSFINKKKNSLKKLAKSNFLNYFDDKILVENSSSLNDTFFENLEENKIKKELYEKIFRFLKSENFDKAKDMINLLEDLFFENQEGLKKFIKKHPFFKEYKTRIEKGKKEHFVEKGLTLSASKLSTYENCPKQYMYSYIYKIPTKSKFYFDFGTSIHSALEFSTKEENKKIWEKEDSEIFTIISKNLFDNWKSSSYDTKKLEDEYKKKAIESIKNFIVVQKKMFLEKEKKIVELEKKFELQFDDDKITGFIDRIDFNKSNNSYEIIDYKTSKKAKSENEVKKDLQLYIYAYAIKKLYKNYPKKMKLWFLCDNNKIREAVFDEKILENNISKIREISKKIKDKNFEAKPMNWKCNLCDFKNICKEGKKFTQ